MRFLIIVALLFLIHPTKGQFNNPPPLLCNDTYTVVNNNFPFDTYIPMKILSWNQYILIGNGLSDACTCYIIASGFQSTFSCGSFCGQYQNSDNNINLGFWLSSNVTAFQYSPTGDCLTIAGPATLILIKSCVLA